MTGEQTTKDKQKSDEYDSPWKEAIEAYFQDCTVIPFYRLDDGSTAGTGKPV